MQEKKHNYFYRTTNQINWHYYFGIHSTDDLEDGYIGTGTLLKRAIKKYGKQNFVKIIIADYSTRKEASDHEKLAVTMVQVECDECYNLKTGGLNEATFKHTPEARKKISDAQIGKPSGRKGFKHSEETKLKMKQWWIDNPMSMKDREKVSKTFKGRIHSEESKEKMKIIANERSTPEYREWYRINNTGEKNPMFGKTHSAETLLKMSKSHSGENHPLAKKCIIFGIVYNSRFEASKSVGICETTMKKRIDSDDPKWKDYQNYNS